MLMPDDYEFEPQTAQLMQLFREGTDRIQRDVGTLDEGGEAVSDYLVTLDKADMGLAVIDLLVIVAHLESLLLGQAVEGMEAKK